MRKRLIANVKFVKEALCAAGKLSELTPGPIVPVVPRSARDATQMREGLLKARIFPPFVKYATGPTKGYFRFVVSNEHSKAELEALERAMCGIE